MLSMDPEIPPSFSLLHETYEVSGTTAFPYQQAPECINNSEATTFLALPTKRNTVPLASFQDPNASSNSLKSIASKLLESATNSIQSNDTAGSSTSNNGQKPQQQPPSHSSYLDFKKVLLPVIIDSVQEQQQRQLQKTSFVAKPTLLDPSAPTPQDDVIYANDLVLQDYRQAGLWISSEELDEEAMEKQEEIVKTAKMLLPTESQWYILNQMRVHAGAPERSDKGVEKLLQYYTQLLHLEQKFPFNTEKVQAHFTWFEGFQSDKKVITNCIQYEKGAVLYNLAALYSQLASNQRLWTQDGLKTAAQYFQHAAGVLVYLRDTLVPRFLVKLDKSSDLSEYSLSAMINLMLAQAQECFYEKANFDKASSPLTSMIASQTSDFYEIAYRHAKTNNNFVRTRFPKTWTSQLKAKSLVFSAVAHLHTPCALPGERALGERISRLTVAKAMANKALKLSRDVGGRLLTVVEGYTGTITNFLMLADTANFEKYHQTIVDPRLLAPLKRPAQALVNPTSFEQLAGAKANETSKSNIFHSLVAPNYQEDLKKFLGYVGKTVLEGKNELSQVLKGIEKLSSEIDLNAMSRILATDNSSSEELRVQSNLLVEQLKIYQKEEDIVRTDEMLASLEKMNELIGINVHESLYILDNVDVTAFPATPSIFTAISHLRTTATQCNELLRERKSKLRELRELRDLELDDFNVSEWNESKLTMILPSLDPSFTTLLRIYKSDVTRLKSEAESILAQMDSLKTNCNKRMSSLMTFEDTLRDLVVGDDVRTAIAERQQTLLELEDGVRKSRRERDDVARRLQAVKKSFEDVKTYMQDESESKRIIQGFQNTFKTHVLYRTNIQRELKESSELRHESVQILSRCLKLPLKPEASPVDRNRDPLLMQSLFGHEEKNIEMEFQQLTMHDEDILAIMRSQQDRLAAVKLRDLSAKTSASNDLAATLNVPLEYMNTVALPTLGLSEEVKELLIDSKVMPLVEMEATPRQFSHTKNETWKIIQDRLDRMTLAQHQPAPSSIVKTVSISNKPPQTKHYEEFENDDMETFETVRTQSRHNDTSARSVSPSRAMFSNMNHVINSVHTPSMLPSMALFSTAKPSPAAQSVMSPSSFSTSSSSVVSTTKDLGDKIKEKLFKLMGRRSNTTDDIISNASSASLSQASNTHTHGHTNTHHHSMALRPKSALARQTVHKRRTSSSGLPPKPAPSPTRLTTNDMPPRPTTVLGIHGNVANLYYQPSAPMELGGDAQVDMMKVNEDEQMKVLMRENEALKMKIANIRRKKDKSSSGTKELLLELIHTQEERLRQFEEMKHQRTQPQVKQEEHQHVKRSISPIRRKPSQGASMISLMPAEHVHTAPAHISSAMPPQPKMTKTMVSSHNVMAAPIAMSSSATSKRVSKMQVDDRRDSGLGPSEHGSASSTTHSVEGRPIESKRRGHAASQKKSLRDVVSRMKEDTERFVEQFSDRGSVAGESIQGSEMRHRDSRKSRV